MKEITVGDFVRGGYDLSKSEVLLGDTKVVKIRPRGSIGGFYKIELNGLRSAISVPDSTVLTVNRLSSVEEDKPPKLFPYEHIEPVVAKPIKPKATAKSRSTK